MAQLRIGCVVMAAGNARRFGENKLAVQVQGKALFHRALEAVPAEQFDRTVVVSQYPEVLELAHRMGFVPVPNRHPDWGISHTISLGLGKLPEMDAALFQVADQPLLRRESVGSLVDFYREHPSTSLRWVTTVSGGTPACSRHGCSRSCWLCRGITAAIR